jgi:acetolactate synthase small subunit
MNRIIDYLKEQQRNTFSRETEFLFEKQQMMTRINQLTAQLKAQENINGDLIKRIKMLEFSLRQERVKYAKLAQGNSFDVGSTDIIGQVMKKANLNTNLYEKVAKRRAKAQRPLLLKFLQEIGYDDIFNVDEVNEIKALYDKA